MIEPRLQYAYCQINLETGECTACMTTSYQINMAGYILVPRANDAYIGKYYNFEDGNFYYDPEFTQIFDINAI